MFLSRGEEIIELHLAGFITACVDVLQSLENWGLNEKFCLVLVRLRCRLSKCSRICSRVSGTSLLLELLRLCFLGGWLLFLMSRDLMCSASSSLCYMHLVVRMVSQVQHHLYHLLTGLLSPELKQ